MYFFSLCWPFRPLKISFLLHIPDFRHPRECAGGCHSQTLLPQTFSWFFFFPGWNIFSPVPTLLFFFSTYWILSRTFSLVSSRVAFSWPLPLSIPTCIKCIRKNQVLPCLLFSSPMKWDSLRWEYHNVYHAPLQLAISWCLLQQIVRPSRGGLCAPAFHTSSRATLKEGASKRNSQCSLRKNQGG